MSVLHKSYKEKLENTWETADCHLHSIKIEILGHISIYSSYES